MIPALTLKVSGAIDGNGEDVDEYAHHAELVCDEQTVRTLLALMKQAASLDSGEVQLQSVVYKSGPSPEFRTLSQEAEGIIAELDAEELAWTLPGAAAGAKPINPAGRRLHVAPDVIWWNAMGDYGLAEMSTTEVRRAHLLCALLWTAAEAELPPLLEELCELDPPLVLDLLDGTLVLHGKDETEHVFRRSVPAMKQTWMERLLTDSDAGVRQRAILLLRRLSSEPERPARRR